jgi:hypothetical protein
MFFREPRFDGAGGLWIVRPEDGSAVADVYADPLSLERLVLDTVISGRALRAVMSGVSYYRSPVP